LLVDYALQDYEREKTSLLLKQSLLPKLHPALDDESIRAAIEKAFERTRKTRRGNEGRVIDTPEDLVKTCLRHLKERNDPIIGASLFSSVGAKEVFETDAISHELQRYRMKIGQFYQYLILELMWAASKRQNSHIINAADGRREGDIQADVRLPNGKELRLYISVKKSGDTVGGQDLGDAIKRLEQTAKEDQNRTSAYMCVMAIANAPKGRLADYGQSRQIKNDLKGRPYSMNCEVWGPGFVFPYISGKSANDIYKEASKLASKYLPFYSIKFRKECAALLHQELIKMGVATAEGKVLADKLFEYIESGSTSQSTLDESNEG
jgi:hypothetical protein